MANRLFIVVTICILIFVVLSGCDDVEIDDNPDKIYAFIDFVRTIDN
jgi:hypothetical protein